MRTLKDIPSLEALYSTPCEASQRKVAPCLTPTYRTCFMTTLFCVLTTVGPEGTDGSPRGDDGPVVLELDPQTFALPDWRGNQRLDSLRNIVVDGRVSLMFMVPGSNTVVRVNGSAVLCDDPDVVGRFEQKGRHPTTVIVVRIAEVYTQCARALIRAGLWARDDSAGLPTVGEIMTDVTEGDFDGVTYDADWAARAAKTMW